MQPDDLADELYEDPLPEEAVFRNVLRPSTTFVIGRKGTGKSTVFQRLQSHTLEAFQTFVPPPGRTVVPQTAPVDQVEEEPQTEDEFRTKYP